MDFALPCRVDNAQHVRGVEVDAVGLACEFQIAGLIARRILNYVEADTPLHAGERYGFIRFGSRVDLYLPLDAKPRVTIGDKVKASETILAELA